MNAAHFFLLSSVGIVGCSESKLTVEVVVPDNHKGDLRIEKNQDKGVVILPKGQKITFVIPASGVLYVKDLDPFFKWHKPRIMYQDGGSVAVDFIGAFAGTKKDGEDKISNTDFDGTYLLWRIKSELKRR